MLVLQTLASMGPLHGYGIARRIEQQSGDEVLLNEGTIYAALVRLQQRAWISGRMGSLRKQPPGEILFHHPRRAKTPDRGNLYWQRLSTVIGRVLSPESGKK